MIEVVSRFWGRWVVRDDGDVMYDCNSKEFPLSISYHTHTQFP